VVTYFFSACPQVSKAVQSQMVRQHGMLLLVGLELLCQIWSICSTHSSADALI
jgi:hypothetical protein